MPKCSICDYENCQCDTKWQWNNQYDFSKVSKDDEEFFKTMQAFGLITMPISYDMFQRYTKIKNKIIKR